MIVYTIYRPDRKWPVSHERPESVFDSIMIAFGEEIAIEASSWCELACVGERFEGDPRFTIEVEEL